MGQREIVIDGTRTRTQPLQSLRSSRCVLVELRIPRSTDFTGIALTNTRAWSPLLGREATAQPREVERVVLLENMLLT